jgi:hypothetical protein
LFFNPPLHPNMPSDQDILFGNCSFLDEHPGTKKWASILGTYSQQYYWSDSVYQKIRSDKRMEGRQYMMLISTKKFRLATEEEIEERTSAVFENGGGKKRPLKRRKTRHSLPSDDSAVDDVLNDFIDRSEIRAFENENDLGVEAVPTARQTRSRKRKDSGSSRKPAKIPPSPAASSSPNQKPSEEIFHRLVVQRNVDMEEVVKQALSRCNTAVKLSNEAGIGSTVETVMSGEAAKWSEQTLSTIFSPTILAALPQAKKMQDKATQQSNKEEGGLQRLAALAMQRNVKKWKQAQKHLANFVQCLVDDL